jgi:hypothetical protein
MGWGDYIPGSVDDVGKMQKEEDFSSMIDEVKLLIKYAVSAQDRDKADSFAEKYQNNRVAVILLKEYYSFLPEAREEAVIRIVRIDMHQGVFMLGVSTDNHEYLFFATEEEAGCLGEYQEPVGDEEIFTFFGYSDKESFLQNHPSMAEFEDFETVLSTNEAFCPVCSTAVGEHHHLGCPVEVCPWCLGQLSKCNCRFEQLDKEEMEGVEDLERFEAILDEKGRIRFEPGQGPSYPVAGKKEK